MVIPSEYLTAIRNASSGAESSQQPSEVEPLTPGQLRRIAHVRKVALEIMETLGPDKATVEEISNRAGISSRTFFRYFPSKEAVLYSDHGVHLAAVDAALKPNQDRVARVIDVLSNAVDDFRDDPEFFKRRYELSQVHSTLRGQEVLWLGEYERHIGDYLAADATDPTAEIRARMMAASLTAAFRHALSRWAQQPTTLDPVDLFKSATRNVAPRGADSATSAVTTLIFTTALTPEEASLALDGIAVPFTPN
jgi:AcrR family transcriptional regulator